MSQMHAELTPLLVREVIMDYFAELRRLHNSGGAPNFSVDGSGCDL